MRTKISTIHGEGGLQKHLRARFCTTHSAWKTWVFFFAWLCCSQYSFGQGLEIKANPVLLPFGYPQLNAEFLIGPDFAVEPGALLVEETFIGYLIGKYYFNPSERENDQFYIGAFLNYVSDIESPGVGFYTGYKFSSKRYVTFELGGGVGRAFNGEFTGTGILGVGYRFRPKASKKQP